MLALFRKDFIGNALLLIPYCALIRIKTLLEPQTLAYQESYGYFNKWWMVWLEDRPLTSSIIMIFAISMLAYFINVISNRSMIYHRKTLFPAVLFVLLSSFLDSFLYPQPVHFGLIFLLGAFINIMSAFKKTTSAGLVFNTGFFLGFASLFYFPFVLFFFFGFFSLMIMKSFRFRDRLQYIIGFLVPYGLAVAGFYVIFNQTDILISYIIENVGMIPLDFDFSLQQYIAFGVFMVMVLFTILQYNSYLAKKIIQVRKNTEILYWIMLFSIPSIFFWKNLELGHLLILVPSLSILLAMSFSMAKNKWAVEVVHIMALGVLYFIHFGI